VQGNPSNKKQYLFLTVLLWTVWALLQVWVLIWMGFPLRTAVIDSVICNGLLGEIGFLIRNILRYYRPGKAKFFYIFVWCLCIAAIWTGIVKWVLPQLITEADYISFLNKSLPIRFFIAFLMTGWIALIYWLFYTFEENRENEKRKAEADKFAKDAELYKLRQQLHPHFLFNSLNSINSLIVTKPEEARHMIQQLADFLRGTLKSDEQTFVTFEEELDHLQLYLDIEKVRFGHRLKTIVEREEISNKSKVPQMVLQPIVENAIKFGLYDTTGVVTIKIKAVFVSSQLDITVENPFDPATASSRNGTGFGLTSIRRRLYLLYARQDLLETRAEGNIFTTIIKIPQLS
jgi:two-component system, LytTR family, sensor kinase